MVAIAFLVNNNASAQPTVIYDTGMPPIIMTQVELWGPVSFHTDGVKLCNYDFTSLGPWALSWVELYNTKNETMLVNDVSINDGNGEDGYPQITLEPHERCYIPTHDMISTRVGPGGSLGNDAPPHDNTTITLVYSIQPFAGKTLYKYSTPKLNDGFGDTRTWQLVNGTWVFREENIKHEFQTKRTLLPPARQMDSGINIKDLECANGLVPLVKKSDPTNWYIRDLAVCAKPSSTSKLVARGWAIPVQTIKMPDTNSTFTYYSEGSKIETIVPSMEFHGLRLDLQTTSDSKMTIFVPRSFIDTLQMGDYTSFNVTADGNKIDYREHLTPTDRMFTVLFKNGTKTIQIIPMFGTANQ